MFCIKRKSHLGKQTTLLASKCSSVVETEKDNVVREEEVLQLYELCVLGLALLDQVILFEQLFERDVVTLKQMVDH